MKTRLKRSKLQYWYEVYLTGESLPEASWQAIVEAISKQLNTLSNVKIAISFDKNVVHYYIGTPNDVVVLSGGLQGILLRPLPDGVIPGLQTEHKERSVSFVTGGTIFDQREAYQVKRQKTLVLAIFNVKIYTSKKYHTSVELYFESAGGQITKAKKVIVGLPLSLLSVQFSEHSKYLKNSLPLYLDIQKSIHLLKGDNAGALFEVDTFPYLARPYYLPIWGFDFAKHSLIVGASGSGKSKLLSLFVDRLNANQQLRQNYKVIIIDPHASIEHDIVGIQDSTIVNFKNQHSSADLFSSVVDDVTAATELSAELFKTLLADQFNPKLERVLRYSIYVLLSAQILSLDSIKRFLTDIEYRNQVLKHVEGFAPPNVSHFFGSDFNELRSRHYDVAISPIISLVDELLMGSFFETRPGVSPNIAQLIQNNFLTVFSLQRIKMGEKVVKLIAGFVMQQVFLLAQSRLLQEKIILIIDEVSVVENDSLRSMLAEARKYNLFVYLGQQYFGQISKELREAIQSNIQNCYVFRVSEDDAKLLEGSLKIDVPDEVIKSEQAKGIKESDIKIKMLTAQNERECFVRVAAGGQLVSSLKARTVTFMPSTAVQEVSLATYTEPERRPSKFVEQVPEQIVESQKVIGVLPGAVSASDILRANSSGRKKL